MAEEHTVNDFDLYANGYIVELPGGDKLLRREKIEYSSQEPDEYHTVIAGDTLTYIAWKYYEPYTDNAPKYYKYIADVNNIKNPLDLTEYVGKNIIIPNFSLVKLKE